MSESTRVPMHWFRWYDKYPNIRAVIRLTEGLPLADQEDIGKQFLDIIQTFWNKHCPFWKDKVPSSEILYHLQKNHEKNRWYDQVPYFYRAFNLILLVPESYRHQLDHDCGILVGYISTYKRQTQPVRIMCLPARFTVESKS